MKFFDFSEEPGDTVMLTPWSLVHFLVGMTSKGFNIPFLPFFGAHFAYEYKDWLYHERAKLNNVRENYNTLTNNVGDQLSATLGWYLARNNDSSYAVFLSLMFVINSSWDTIG